MTPLTAREDILRRIREANRRDPGEDAASAWEALPRNYIVAGRRAPTAVLDRLEERLHDYDATVVRCDAGCIRDAIAERVKQRGIRSFLVPAGLPPEWLPAGLPCTVDSGFRAMELDGFDAVLTGATLAIAETGTVVLQSVPGQGRRAVSLVPDIHLCVVRTADVVETVPEAMARLAATATLPTTFVSGPSATADIEMTRIKGVHGPRTLDIILVT